MDAKRFLAVFVAVATIFFGSCKDELTLPATVHFEFGMVTFQNEDPAQGGQKNNVPSPNRYAIDSGVLRVDAIEFDGRRSHGKDVYFISNFSEAIVSQLESQSSNIKVDFDIPQGEYNRVDITLHLVNGTDIPFRLEGAFSYGQSNVIPIHFEYAYTEEITIRAKPKVGTSIILSKEKVSNARVIVDTEFLFRFLNPGVIANANRVVQGGEEIILINQLNNVDVFNQVANRFSKSISVEFE
ncbi:MAG: hypothetical protein RBT19_07560 [Tenuifilaceae bacterium]|jgi:hypothetical protein|nr:hypothetical protein [Tenuifilaceae bacterium]